MNLTELKEKPINELVEMAEAMGIENVARSRKQDIIFSLLKRHAKSGEDISGDGVLEILSDGFGFLRSADSSYLAGPDDIYVSPSQIRRFNLRTGDTISGKIRPPKDGERYFALLKVSDINFSGSDSARQKVLFENLTPLFPEERLKLEQGNGSSQDLSGRIMDLVSPIGKGQRGLIVSPPKAGKTMLMQQLAHAISRNHPSIELAVLLIDERPEEVTDMRRSIKGEVFASSSDSEGGLHVRLAQLVLEYARRKVETGKDVVVLMDSLTRLGRAFNVHQRGTGRTMSGGVDVRALEIPKRMFGAARKIEGGGSLTMIATALIQTESRMDELIFQEFKGTGNMELVLDRELADERIFPAISLNLSGTRREELLFGDENDRHEALSRSLSRMRPREAMLAVQKLLEQYPTNAILLSKFT